MNNIKKFRKKNKISQLELARILKVGQSTVSMWETGDIMPRADKMPMLAKILNCSIDDLFKNDNAS